jgi:lipoprotein signal peptidase
LLYESQPIIRRFDSTHTRNTGVAFGLFANTILVPYPDADCGNRFDWHFGLFTGIRWNWKFNWLDAGAGGAAGNLRPDQLWL